MSPTSFIRSQVLKEVQLTYCSSHIFLGLPSSDIHWGKTPNSHALDIKFPSSIKL